MSSLPLKPKKFLKEFQAIRSSNIKFRGPLIVKMFGALNKYDLRNENRYILCNFIDQISDLLNFRGDIYSYNNTKSIEHLFLMAYNGAKKNGLLDMLYDEYHTCFQAITSKKEFVDI